MPCNHCSSRNIKGPCFKLHGPKKEALLAPSRPIPTAIDDVLDGKEVLWLQYLYCGPFLVRLFRYITKFPTRYGAALPCLPLRYAALALVSYKLCRKECGHYLKLAHKELRRRLDGHSALLSSDLVAATFVDLLAWLAYEDDSPNRLTVYSYTASAVFRRCLQDLEDEYFWDILQVRLFYRRFPPKKRIRIRSLLVGITLTGCEVNLRPSYTLANPSQYRWNSLWGAMIVFRLHDSLCFLLKIVFKRLDDELLGYETEKYSSIFFRIVSSILQSRSFRNAISIAAKWATSEKRIKLILI